MCLSDLVRLVDVDVHRAVAVGELGGERTPVSLAVLTLDGVEPEVGDWVVVVTGLAVERLTADEAAEVHRERARLVAADHADQARSES